MNMRKREMKEMKIKEDFHFSLRQYELHQVQRVLSQSDVWTPLKLSKGIYFFELAIFLSKALV